MSGRTCSRDKVNFPILARDVDLPAPRAKGGPYVLSRDINRALLQVVSSASDILLFWNALYIGSVV